MYCIRTFHFSSQSFYYSFQICLCIVIGKKEMYKMVEVNLFVSQGRWDHLRLELPCS